MGRKKASLLLFLLDTGSFSQAKRPNGSRSHETAPGRPVRWHHDFPRFAGRGICSGPQPEPSCFPCDPKPLVHSHQKIPKHPGACGSLGSFPTPNAPLLRSDSQPATAQRNPQGWARRRWPRPSAPSWATAPRPPFRRGEPPASLAPSS